MVYVHPLLETQFIKFLEADTKDAALDEMIQMMSDSPNISDEKSFRKAVFDREALMSTGLGLGIAIPHVKIKSIKDISIGIGIHKKGLDWDALDGEAVHIVVMIAGSDTQHDTYLRTLSKIVLVLKNKKRREKMIQSSTPEEIVTLFENI